MCSIIARAWCTCESEESSRLESTGGGDQLRRQANQFVYETSSDNAHIGLQHRIKGIVMLLVILLAVSSLVRKLKQQAREQMEERRPNLVAALHQMGDFYMELKWDFQSWGKSLASFYLW